MTRKQITFEDFDENIFLEELDASIFTLPEPQQIMINEALQYTKNKRDFWHLYEWMIAPDVWKLPKVSLDTFLDDPNYLGIGATVYPKVREICREVIEGGYREGVEVAGIGSGKSFSAEILACYAAHHLLCLNNPHGYYGLSPDKSIAIMNMGINATQALEVVFTGIRNFIDMSPFFKQFRPNIKVNSVRFEYEKILLTSGNSKATTPLGYNVFYAILDEAAFYLDNDEKSVAQEIYESLQRRIVSRFGNDGLLMMISSPRYTEDFIMRKLAESYELDEKGKRKYPHIYSIQLPTWKVKGTARADMKNLFYFNHRKGEISPVGTTQKELEDEGYKVNRVEDPTFTDKDDIWEIPGEYKASFSQNPEKAKRDFGATPSETLSGFIPNATYVTNMWNKARKNPLVSPGKYKFAERPLRIPYYIHLDLGFNRDGLGDHTGFAMGHFGGWVTEPETGEQRMKFVIDVTERIGILGDTGEIDLADVRRRIYDLKAMGFYIKLVTFDQFASKDFRQILEKKGFKTDLVSVDRTIDPYDCLKESIYEDRIDCHYDETLERELKQLELIKGIKVDHPPHGSKDLADAVAGVCWNIIEHTPTNHVQMQAAMNDSNIAPKMKQHIQQKMREDEVKRKQRIVDKQMEIERKMDLR